MLGRTQLGVKAYLDKRLEYASIALIRTLSIRTLHTSLEINTLSINNIWQLGQRMLIKTDSLLINHLVLILQSSSFSIDVLKAPK